MRHPTVWLPAFALGIAFTACPSTGWTQTVQPDGEPNLQAMLDKAKPGSEIDLKPGIYWGPLVLRREMKLTGPRSAIIRSGGQGTTVRMLGKNCVLKGLTVDGSGSRYETQDSGIYVYGDGAQVLGVDIRHCLFGIWAESSRGVELTGNRITGDQHQAIGLRGDAIHLWEVSGSLVADNLVKDSRDVVVWYSPDNRLLGNRIMNGRYGTHFMYSDDNEVESGDYTHDVVGIFSMYSRNLRIKGSRFKDCVGATGFGFGAKESGNLTLTDNVFEGDTVGLHLDNSPYKPGDSNLFRDNRFSDCTTAVNFNGVAQSSRFMDNAFFGNRSQLRVDGNDNALKTQWDENYFDDYQGYDIDGDGIGDVLYEFRNLTDDLAGTHPSLDLFQGTPALLMLCIAGRVLPLYQPALLMADQRPRMRPPVMEAGRGY